MRILTALAMIFVGVGLIVPKEQNMQPVAIKNAFEAINLPLKTGDIVLRSGKGFISALFRRTSVHHSKFSHAGVLVQEKGIFYVYHMLEARENKHSGLRKDKLSDFCNSNENTGFAIYRYQSLYGKENDVAAYLENLAKEKLVFDDAFDLATENALYCSEMIYKLVLKTTGLKLPISTIKGKSYIAIDNLYLNNESTKITELFY